MMKMKKLPAAFMRGGTSNGLVLHRRDLPADISQWRTVLAAAMGSPDGYGRQLDGMGSGVSSTSKVCVVERSSRADADLDYTFVQVGIKDGAIDMAGNCGNLSAAVGPFGWDEGLLHDVYHHHHHHHHPAEGSDADANEDGKHEVHVRIFNTNTAKLITATFAVNEDGGAYDPFGEYSIDGVPGTGSKITLSFQDPAGAKTGKALPTGNPIDMIELADGTRIAASLIDIANPGVFVRAEDLGLPGEIEPTTLEANANIMARLEDIRQAGTKLMGLDPSIQSVPKIVIVSTPSAARVAEGVNIVCRALSMQQPHKAVPLTLGLNLGTACRIPGTIPAEMAVGVHAQRESVTIAHASGKVDVGSVFRGERVVSALLHRTARTLMKGDVFYAAADVAAAAAAADASET
jgi:2-methylaconitate cis-trans-isomerase PrpF